MISAERRSLILKLHDEHAPKLLHRARVMGASRDEAEDLLQEVLLAAATTRVAVEHWGGWLHSAMTFKVIDQTRRRQREEVRDDLDPCSEADDAEGTTYSRQRLEMVAAALKKLTPVQLEVLILREAEGLSGAEASELLGVGTEVIHKRLFEARSALKRLLAKVLRHSVKATASEDRHVD